MESIDNQQLFFFGELKNLLLIVGDFRVGHWVELAQRLVEPFLKLIT